MSEHEIGGPAGPEPMSGPSSDAGPNAGPNAESDPELDERLRQVSPASPFPRERIEARVRASAEGQAPELRRFGRQASSPVSGHAGATAAERLGGHAAEREVGPPGGGGEGRRAAWAALVAAAAILVFVAGVEYGRGTAASPGLGTDDAASVQALDDALDHALRIQWAGSRWVATLARFSREAPEVDDAARRAAREVATTIFYAAALELLVEAGEDELMETIAWLAHTRRQALQPTEAEPAAGEVSRTGDDESLRGAP